MCKVCIFTIVPSFKLQDIRIYSSPQAFMDPVSTNLTHMFVTLFQDALNEYAYDAELAGLNYDLHNTIYGLSVSIASFWERPSFRKFLWWVVIVDYYWSMLTSDPIKVNK